MARKMRNPRFPIINGGKYGEAVPVAKVWVNPGESLKKLKYQMRLQSMPTKFPLTGAYVDVWFYYVPIRTVWPEWESFLLGGEETIPKHPNPQPNFFNRNANKSKLYGMCYTEIINRYYRTKEDAEHVYGAAYARLPKVDMTAEALGVQDLAGTDQTIDMTDGLTIKEIDQARADQRYERKMLESTGHYADFLKLNGVHAQSKTVQDPEPIGHVRSWVMPSKSIDQSTGFTVQSYFKDVKMRLSKPRFFPEHGYIVGIASIRPKVVNYQSVAVEDVWTDAKQVPHVGQPMALRELQDESLEGTSTGDFTYYTDHYMLYGNQLSGAIGVADDQMWLGHDPVTADEVRIPTPAYENLHSGVSSLVNGAHFQLDGVTSVSIATPLNLQHRLIA